MTTRVGALGVVEKAAGVTFASLSLPAGAAVGDTALAGGGANTNTLSGAQTGWTTLINRTSTGDTLAPSAGIWRKVLDATDITNGFVTLDSLVSAAGNFGGAVFRDMSATQDFTAVYLDKTATSASFTFPTQTTTETGVTLFYLISQATVANGTMTPPSTPAAFTEDADRTAGRNVSMGDLIWSGSGATGTMTVTSTATTRGVGLLVAFRAAAAAAPVPDVIMAPRIGV